MQELAFALANAIAVLDTVKAAGQVPEADLPQVVGRISFFVNAGVRFITEMCKMRAFAELWDEICRERYGVTDEKLRRFRYGVQVNSLGLTEQQPENNVYRILLEMLAVVLSKSARARSVQLPAWNEALGLPRPWDQQWSLRLQQIVAYETDLLDYGDIFDGAPVIEAKVAELMSAARAEMARIEEMGGAVAAIEGAYMKERLVESNSRRLRAIESGEQPVVGVNVYTDSAPSPLTAGTDGGYLDRRCGCRGRSDRASASLARGARRGGRGGGAGRAETGGRRGAQHHGAVDRLRPCRGDHRRMGRDLARCFRRIPGADRRRPPVCRPRTPGWRPCARRVEEVSKRLGRRLKILVGKPGLDGHSNGAEQIAVRARDAGFEVVYEGIRLTPAQIVNTALEEGVHVVGLSVLSGSHLPLITDVLARLRAAGLGDIPVVAGGIVPPEDAAALRDAGVAAVYTPKDFDLTAILADIVEIVDRATREAA